VLTKQGGERARHGSEAHRAPTRKLRPMVFRMGMDRRGASFAPAIVIRYACVQCGPAEERVGGCAWGDVHPRILVEAYDALLFRSSQSRKQMSKSTEEHPCRKRRTAGAAKRTIVLENAREGNSAGHDPLEEPDV